MNLVDSNVLLDIFTRDPTWWEWSMMRLEEAALRGGLLINYAIYAETSVRFRRIEDVDAALDKAGLSIAPIPRPALFLAGKAFTQYRSSSGLRTGVLPDFFIGAHAMAVSVPLLTRDARRYRRYFPAAKLIAPAPASPRWIVSPADFFPDIQVGHSRPGH